jgi:hypothetical protein
VSTKAAPKSEYVIWKSRREDAASRGFLGSALRESWELSDRLGIDYETAGPEVLSPAKFNQIKQDAKRLFT